MLQQKHFEFNFGAVNDMNHLHTKIHEDQRNLGRDFSQFGPDSL